MLKNITQFRVGVISLATLVLMGCSGSSADDFSPKSEIIEGINYIGLSVSDLNASTEIYQNPTSMKIVDEDDLTFSFPDSEVLLAKSRLMRSANAQIRLMEFGSASDIPPVEVQGPGIAHIAFQVAEETNTYEKLLGTGATHIGERKMVQLNPKNPVKYAYAKDQDGTIIEVEQVDIQALNLPTPPKNKFRIRQVSLATPDLKRIVKFYSALLDDPKPRQFGRLMAIGNEKMDAVTGLEGSKLKMAWFQTRNLEIEIFQYASHPTNLPDTPRPINALGYNMIIFDVNDIDAIRTKFEAAGGKSMTKTIPIDDGEGFYGRDPDGNILGFVNPPPNSVFSSQNFIGNGTE